MYKFDFSEFGLFNPGFEKEKNRAICQRIFNHYSQSSFSIIILNSQQYEYCWLMKPFILFTAKFAQLERLKLSFYSSQGFFLTARKYIYSQINPYISFMSNPGAIGVPTIILKYTNHLPHILRLYPITVIRT